MGAVGIMQMIAVWIAMDMSEGIIARFRTMAIAAQLRARRPREQWHRPRSSCRPFRCSASPCCSATDRTRTVCNGSPSLDLSC